MKVAAKDATNGLLFLCSPHRGYYILNQMEEAYISSGVCSRLRIPLAAILLQLLVRVLALSQGTNEQVEESLVVFGRQVVFYGPNQAEIDSLKGVEWEAMNEVVGDFQFCLPGVNRWLETAGIPSQFSVARFIRFRLAGDRWRDFDRLKEKAPLGMILTDGVWDPACFPGVNVESGWIEETRHISSSIRVVPGVLQTLQRVPALISAVFSLRTSRSAEYQCR